MARGKSRRRGPSTGSLILRYGSLAAALGLAATGGGIALARYSGQEKIGLDYCFARDGQPQAAIFVDASVSDVDAAQRRDFKAALQRAWDHAKPNTRLTVFSTAKGDASSIGTPTASFCRPPATADEFATIGAPSPGGPRAAFLADQARAAWQEAITAIVDYPAERAARQSPILEQMAAISRNPDFKGEERSLAIITDGLENSELGHFGVVKGEMPEFAKFANHERFQPYRPDLSGVAVTMLLVEYPDGALPYATNAELEAFWADYLSASGAASFTITPVRSWGEN